MNLISMDEKGVYVYGCSSKIEGEISYLNTIK